MRILVLEPHATGHHGPYLEWMITGLLDYRFEVTLVTLSGSMTHSSVQSLSHSLHKNAAERLQIIPSSAISTNRAQQNQFSNLVTRELKYWHLFRAWYKQYQDLVQPDVVFLPYLDYCLYAIGLLGSPFGKCCWVALAMRPSFHYRGIGIVASSPSLAKTKEALFMRLLRNRYLRCMLTIDETLLHYVAQNMDVSPRLRYLPDPSDLTDIPNKRDAKEQLGIPLGRRIILVYGAISVRKGVLELLRALTSPTFPQQVDVLLAGVISHEIRDALTAPEFTSLVNQARLRLIDRFIEKNEEPAIFGAADIVWLGYRGHITPSGVLTQAVSTGRPVLACEEGVIGWQTRQYGLGEVVRPTDTGAVIAAIRSMIDGNFRQPNGVRPADESLITRMSASQRVLAKAVVGSAS